MMPQNFGANGKYGAWPASGEIDIAEVRATANSYILMKYICLANGLKAVFR
jgi:hypothetical protein